jgi:hypothetical protein
MNGQPAMPLLIASFSPRDESNYLGSDYAAFGKFGGHFWPPQIERNSASSLFWLGSQILPSGQLKFFRVRVFMVEKPCESSCSGLASLRQGGSAIMVPDQEVSMDRNQCRNVNEKKHKSNLKAMLPRSESVISPLLNFP